MPIFDVILAIAVTLCGGVFFYLYHGRRARPGHENKKSGLVWPAGRWIDWYLKLSTLGAVLGALLYDHSVLLEFHNNTVLLVAGLVIGALGFAMFLGALHHLGANYAHCYDSRLPRDVIMTGPYRFVRHPIYVSNVVMLVGLLIATGSAWLVLNLLILGFYYGAVLLREERALLGELPGYADYADRTGRFFPRLSAFRRPST